MKAIYLVLIGLAISILHPFKLDELPETHPLVARYTQAATDCITAIDDEMPDASDAVKEKYARQLYVFAYDEASWETNPYGCKPGTISTSKYGQVTKCLAGGVWEGTNDGGNACGVGQVHVDEIQTLSNWKGVLEPSWTCRAVRKDRVLGFRVMLRVLLQLEKDCGSTAAAWSAYAGTLGCKSYVMPLVKKRCKRAGLTELCELPEAA